MLPCSRHRVAAPSRFEYTAGAPALTTGPFALTAAAMLPGSLTWALIPAMTTVSAASKATTTIFTWVPRSALSSEWFIGVSLFDPRTAAGSGSVEPESPRAVRGHDSPRRRGSRFRGGHDRSGRSRTRPRGRQMSRSHHGQDHDFGADVHAAVEIGHVIIEHADAAARHLMADGGRRVGPVDTIDGVAEIHGARAERTTG